MRDFKSESHGLAQGVPFAMSGADLALMVIALFGAHIAGLIVTATISLTAYLAWQLTGLARHRVVPLPGGPYAATDTVEAHVARVAQSERRFGTTSRKSCDPTI